MNLHQLTETQLIFFSLILIRISCFVFSAAIFSMPMINAHTKILFCVLLSMLIYPILKTQGSVPESFSLEVIGLAAREVFIGLTLGFITRIVFFAVAMAGEMVSTAIGLNSAQLFNPMMGSSGNIIEQFHVIIGSMLFFSLNGHHLLVSSIMESFQLVPLSLSHLSEKSFAEMALVGQDLLIISTKMSAPVIVAILFANVAMGLVGRAIPQMNVFVTSFPITVMLGLGILFMCLPFYKMEFVGLLDLTSHKLFQMMKSF